MRRIIMFNRVSADGCFADNEGGLNWTVPDDTLDAEATHGIATTDAMLFGRRTYDMFESYWPHAIDQDPHAAGRHNDAIAAMANWINNSEKIVFSRTRKEVSWQNSRLLHDFDPKQVTALKQSKGGDIIVFGSGSIVSLLTQHRLIDEYRFVVGPVLLGSGKQPITGLPSDIRLELMQTKQYRSGNIALSYTLAAQG